MARLVIESFEDFLEEYKIQLNEKEGGTTPDSIAIMSASTSTSDLQQSLAKDLGIEKDKSYTFTIELLALMYSLGSNKKFDPKVIGTGTPVKKGADILTIGDKTINEKGDIYISMKDASKGVKITASNNGMLCLARMGAAFNEAITKYKISLYSGKTYGGSNMHECKDWLIKFTLGGNVKSDASRGYTLYYAYPGSLREYASLNTVIVAMTMLEFTKFDYLIARKGASPMSPDKFDKVIDPKYNQYIKGTKSIGEALQKFVSSEAVELTKRGMFVNQSPKINQESADAFIKNAGSYYISGSPSEMVKGKSTVALTAEGIKDFKKVLSDMAESLVPALPEGWGKEADPIFAQYKSAIKDGLSASNVPEWLGTVQRVSSWGSGSSSLGSVGSTTKKQGEGKY